MVEYFEIMRIRGGSVENDKETALKPLECPRCREKGYHKILLYYLLNDGKISVKCPSCKKIVNVNS